MQEICSKIAKIVETYVEDILLQENDYETDLVELGMDSTAFIHVVVEMEEFFDVEIPDEYLLLSELNTINKMVQIIQPLIAKKQF